MSDVVEVKLWGSTIGHLGYAPEQNRIATFEFDETFTRSGIQVSPVKMPYPPVLHTFDDISFKTFNGLPGIFADSLPDKFGNQLIDLYMAERNTPVNEITALDRLLYIGNRSMGALEYHPAQAFFEAEPVDTVLDIKLLAELARMVTSKEDDIRSKLSDAKSRSIALKLIRIGSSAGGARSKALVARTPDGKVLDGTIDHGTDCTYWLLKFDSDSNEDRDSSDPKGMPRIEYIYSLLAGECGIDIPKTDYMEDGDDFHFLIERFDRIPENGKLTKQYYTSWAGLSHADRDTTGTYSYEQLVLLARELGLGQDAITELFRRTVFNVIGRNQDDHTKNFGFLMDKSGQWRLSPAFDMTYAFDPSGKWTSGHQIRLNRKQDNFTRDDLIQFGKYCNLTEKKALGILSNTVMVFTQFPHLAGNFNVPRELAKTVEANLRRI